ncbi:hypothetical protein I302_106954 [Kwoniella bestiolae CBS 10118]|uniref:Helicase ATP-binding domain-containing protein n=1 Tax=Kwoniella bestiolae CBS 10118 TaxID=1296100 RepID=A0A1B9FZY5_9TREE|nr:hypothetical protein I302_05782 [Kwoniella bestiolae CBS 10118]OCF24323.1 hypothetical protein I302_05782 [Kwoniella bestiolae CBS 10118]
MSQIYIDHNPPNNSIASASQNRFWRESDEVQPARRTTAPISSKSRATLIVCPKSIVGVWVDMIEHHWQGPNGGWANDKGVSRPQDRPLVLYNHYEKQKQERIEKLKQASIIITTYEALTASHRKKGLLHKSTFYRVVLDEGHHIYNSKTQRFLAVEALHKRHIHVLTGTPVQNQLAELHAYARLFDLPSGLSSSYVFESKITSPALQGNTAAVRKFGKIFSIRRLKKDLSDVNLPPKKIKVFWLSEKMLLEALQGVEDRSLSPVG